MLDLLLEVIIDDFNPLQMEVFKELQKRHNINVSDLIMNDVDTFKLISKMLRKTMDEISPNKDAKIRDLPFSVEEIKEKLILAVEEELGLIPATA